MAVGQLDIGWLMYLYRGQAPSHILIGCLQGGRGDATYH